MLRPRTRARDALAVDRITIACAVACALTVVAALPAEAQDAGGGPRQALTHRVQVRVPAVAGVLASSPMMRAVGARGPGTAAYASIDVRVASNVPSELRIRLDMPPGAPAPDVTAALPGAERAPVAGSGWTTLPGVVAPGVGELVVTVHAGDRVMSARDLAGVRLAFDLVPLTASDAVHVLHRVAEHAPPTRSTLP